jgi:hypothetical protein
MTELVKQYNPVGKAETFDVWRPTMHMPVPSAADQILDLRIFSIDESAVFIGLQLVPLIDAQKTKNDLHDTVRERRIGNSYVTLLKISTQP